METRARYVLIGAITLLGFLAAMGFLLWLGRVQLDRTYALYDVLFDSVEGLGNASPVRYNGVDVGQVRNIALDRADPGRVRVTIEIFAATPVREDTVATLASQGVTGVSFVSLAGGTANSPLLAPVPPASIAVIRSERSLLQGLTVDAPDLLTEALARLRELGEFTGPENREAVAQILQNVEAVTGRVDTAMINLESIMQSVQVSADKIAVFTERLDAIGLGAESVLAEADTTLSEATGTFARANTLIDERFPAILEQVSSALQSIEVSATGFRTFATTGLPEFASLATDARTLVGSIGALTAQIARDPGRFLLGNQTPAYRR